MQLLYMMLQLTQKDQKLNRMQVVATNIFFKKLTVFRELSVSPTIALTGPARPRPLNE